MAARHGAAKARTRPWSGEMILRKFEGPVLEYACYEDSYGLANILAAARWKESGAK